ncbi:low molecular weight phosphatase family protein [Microbacterium sp. p3-SID336]|uniref:arsenate reductase/protein-tyrosine-phosphatase family protein n=1 Tax=Microbacterium sp. p3-SID336 TaxID=2916212 RepID=UPI0021A29CFF|nr:low molecular weight phosphatase family protein [Microbacterium sp. p3-SID336]MCT1477809.1 low molecular weight phosphatase family protein [Microbacterium sp. p3-SID336]
MNPHHPDGPPPGMSRRAWREQQAAAATAPSPASPAPATPAPATPAPLDAAPREFAPVEPPRHGPLDALLGQPAADAPRGLTILTVCTGNICRSPLAEVMLRQRLEPLGVRVHSAGTHALVGHGMPEQALELAAQAGVTSSLATAHQARYLVEPYLADADLVLTMAREHRSHAVKMMPSILRRTFTVREFARLAATLSDADARAAAEAAGSSPAERFAAVLRALNDQRGLTAAPPEDDDVVDPYRRSRDTYALSASQLTPALAEVERIVRDAIA